MTQEFIKNLIATKTISTDTSGRWISLEEAQKIIDATVLECTKIINSLDQVENCGDSAISEYIKERFLI